MKKLFFVIFLFWGLSTYSITLSDRAEISILTCSPGDELYSLFGHTGIRIYDQENRIDVVFNYGTFDFNTPHFYLKYAKGLLPYQLSVNTFDNFMYVYKLEQRSVYSQSLRLDSLQKQRMFGLLQENHRPENRSYLYNFLYDNCTTRARDMIGKTFPNPIEWNMADSGKRFWNLLDEYLNASPWVKWGIHTILGQGGNRIASTFEYMFLPDYLMLGLTTASYNGQLVAGKADILYEAPERNLYTTWYRNPFFVFAVCACIIIFMIQYSRNSNVVLNTAALLLFAFSGIVGVLIVFLGFFTEHPITFPNWNILWANPLNLIILPFVIRKEISRMVYKYLTVYIILLEIAIPAWALAQPAVPAASIWIIALMIFLSLKIRNKGKNGIILK